MKKNYFLVKIQLNLSFLIFHEHSSFAPIIVRILSFCISPTLMTFIHLFFLRKEYHQLDPSNPNNPIQQILIFLPANAITDTNSINHDVDKIN